MDQRPFTKRFKYAVIYYFILSLIFVSGKLPRKFWLWICGGLGKVAFLILPATRRLALESLTIAFGNEKSPEEILRIRRRMFIMVGRNAGDVIRARSIDTMEELEKGLEFRGFENYQAAAAKGKGVIFIASHLGAFDLEVNVMSLRGLRINIIGTPLKDPRLNELMFSYRNRLGAVAVERGKEMVRIIRSLKNNEMVAILIDQDTKVKSRFVNFFGRPAATPVGAAILALKTGAAALPTNIYLDEHGVQRMQLYPEMPLVRTGDEEQDMIINTQNFTKFIEDRIREHPEQWLWMHGRWNTKPGEEIR